MNLLTDMVENYARIAFRLSMGYDSSKIDRDWGFHHLRGNTFAFHSQGMRGFIRVIRSCESFHLRVFQTDCNETGQPPFFVRLLCDRQMTTKEARDLAQGRCIYTHAEQRSKENERRRSLRQRHALQGKCTTCGAALPPGTKWVRCEKCRAYGRMMYKLANPKSPAERDAARAWHQRHRMRVVSARLCIYCNEPLPDGCEFYSCDACRAERNHKQNEKRRIDRESAEQNTAD